MKLKLLAILFITTIAFISGFGQTHTVINTNDDGSGSLRFIVVNASPGDTIRFSPTINGDTIRLSTGEITLNKDVVIIGNDTTNTIISGENLSRVLRIPLSITVKLVGLTATKGFLDDSDGNFLFGAGIFNEGDLHVLECKVAKNNINGNGITNNYGGGIANEGGNILIEKSNILSNSIMSSSIATSSFSLGGGFYNGKIGSRTAGTGTLISTSIINNSIYGQERVYGGGLVNQGTLKVANSSVKGNVVSAAYESSRAAGGGVSSEGNLEIYNTVISGNLATSADQAFGGGVEYSGGNLTIINSTVAGNSAKGSSGSLVRGGGFYTSSLGRFILKNTIVSQNLSTGSENNLAFGSSVSFTGENNFTQNNIDPFFVTDVPAAPSVLGDLRLQDCSPAINAGTEDTTGLNLGLVDFIGNPRVFDGRIDIGSYELQMEKANPLLVTNATDNKCGSLRVVVANASAGDTIRFVPTINGDTIKLTSGQILIDKNLTIIGNGQDSTIIDTQGLSRIFEVATNVTLKIDSLTLQNGDVTPNSAPKNLGGAIYVSGRLLVDHSLFQGGKAFAGGAIATDDNTTTDIFIENSTFKNNHSTSLGGAIGFLADTLSIVNSTFSGNSSDFRAGAIRSISANKLILKNATFSDNAALSDAGGALSSSNSSSAIEVESCTFYNNSAISGGAFELDNSTLKLQNSILKNTASGSSDDILTFSTPALVENLGNNLVFSASGTNHTISSGNGIDPLLGILQNNGGTTETHALLCGSPAYNAGAGTDADQRGEPVFGGTKDIGAYESQIVLDGSVPNIHIVMNTNDNGIGSLRYLVNMACAGDTIRFDNAIDGDTIKLSTGEITIDKNLSIIGNGSENTLIDGQANSRILKTEGRADNLYIAHLTLQNGKVDIAVPFTARDARGGAIYANSSGLIKLDHCVIANNMVACTVVTCSTNVSGGGVYSRGDIEMYNCVVSNNQAIGDRGANGGGIYINGAKILLRNTKVLGNSTTSSFRSSQGAGIFLDGEDQSMVFVNSQISGNKSVGTSGSIISEGGGIYINQGDLVLSSVTISGNEAATNGAGVYIKSGDVTANMRNSVIANNTSANGANDIWSGRIVVDEGDNFAKDPNGNHYITNGNGIDPLFIQNVPTAPSTGGNLRLQACSPAINTGTADTTGLNLGLVDLAGNPRVLGDRIDIGAFERTTIPLEITNRTLAEFNELFVCENGTVKIPAGISSSDFTYQWQIDQGSGFSNLTEASPYSQTTADSLEILPISLSMDGFQYRALIADACGGSIISDTITLRVGQLPVLVTSPLTQEVCPGNEVVLEAEFSGGGFSYQWQVDEGSGFVNVSGQDYTLIGNKLLISNFDNAKNNNQYRVLAKSTCFEVPSDAATITINTDVTILAQPTSQSVCEFGTAIFTAQAIKLSTGTLTYQWQRKAGTGNWIDVNTDGRYVVNGNQLQITNAQASWNGAEFRCLINDYCQTIPKTLNVIPVAHVTQNPVNQAICVGNNANFSISAAGEGLTYRWQVNSGSGFVNLTDGGIYQGVTSPNLSLSFPTAAVNGYQYRCVVSGTNTCDLAADTSAVASISIGVSAEAQTVFYNSAISTDEGITQAVGYILGINKILQPNGKAEFRAGNAILLNPGFEVEAGSVFTAKIMNPCMSVTTSFGGGSSVPKELVK